MKEIIDRYGELKKKENIIKKELAELNSEIKNYMRHNNLDTLEGENFVASYTLRKGKQGFDEDKLIPLLKEKVSDVMLADIIKIKEYVDYEKLESAVYHGDIDRETLLEMNKCEITKRTPTLTISIRKWGDIMYISPYWLGIATVVGLELLVLVGVAIVSTIKDKLKERRKK